MTEPTARDCLHDVVTATELCVDCDAVFLPDVGWHHPRADRAAGTLAVRDARRWVAEVRDEVGPVSGYWHDLLGLAIKSLDAALASRPAPRPPEPDRTAALSGALEAFMVAYHETGLHEHENDDRTIDLCIPIATLRPAFWAACAAVGHRWTIVDVEPFCDRCGFREGDDADDAAAPAGAPVADGTAEPCLEPRCRNVGMFGSWHGPDHELLPAAPTDAEAS